MRECDRFYLAWLRLQIALTAKLGDKAFDHPAIKFFLSEGAVRAKQLSERAAILPDADLKGLWAEVGPLFDDVKDSVDQMAFWMGETLSLYDYGIRIIEETTVKAATKEGTW